MVKLFDIERGVENIALLQLYATETGFQGGLAQPSDERLVTTSLFVFSLSSLGESAVAYECHGWFWG